MKRVVLTQKGFEKSNKHNLFNVKYQSLNSLVEVEDAVLDPEDVGFSQILQHPPPTQPSNGLYLGSWGF